MGDADQLCSIYYSVVHEGIQRSQSRRLTEASTRIGFHLGTDGETLDPDWSPLGSSGMSLVNQGVMTISVFIASLCHALTLDTYNFNIMVGPG